MKNHFSFSIIIREMKCILISLLILLVCGFASRISALRCITTDGLQVDEVRRVVKKCMKKVTVDDDETKNYDEYENFEGSKDYEMKDRGSGGARDTNNDRMNRNNNYNPRFNQYDERSAQTGGNYYQETNRPRNDRHDPWMQRQQQQFNPYQQQSPPSYNNNYFASNQRGDFNSNGYQNKHANDNSTSDKHEKDRACILQCFFVELRMVICNFF